MIVALRIQEGGAGKATLRLHLAGQWARQGRRITLIEADPRGSAVEWSEQHARKRLEHLFAVVGLPRDALEREAAELAPLADPIVFDGSLPVAASLSAPLTADPALIRARTSPFDGWPSAAMLGLVAEAHVLRPTLFAHFVFKRRPARSLIAHDAAQSLADHDPPAPASCVGRRVISPRRRAPGGSSGAERRRDGAAARETAAVAAEIGSPAP